MKTRTYGACMGIFLAAGMAHAEGPGAVGGALRETKPIIDLRMRVEGVEQDGLPNEAHATTLRARLGFETGKAWNTVLLVEGEGIVPIKDDYRPDPLVPTMVTYPVVPGRRKLRDQPLPAQQHQPAGHHADASGASASRSTTSASWGRSAGARTSRPSMRFAS